MICIKAIPVFKDTNIKDIDSQLQILIREICVNQEFTRLSNTLPIINQASAIGIHIKYTSYCTSTNAPSANIPLNVNANGYTSAPSQH